MVMLAVAPAAVPHPLQIVTVSGAWQCSLLQGNKLDLQQPLQIKQHSHPLPNCACLGREEAQPLMTPCLGRKHGSSCRSGEHPPSSLR